MICEGIEPFTPANSRPPHRFERGFRVRMPMGCGVHHTRRLWLSFAFGGSVCVARDGMLQAGSVNNHSNEERI